MNALSTYVSRILRYLWRLAASAATASVYFVAAITVGHAMS